jgi:hypothetical protein
MELSRRDFIGMAGGAGAAAMLGLFPGQAQAHTNLPASVTDAITHRTYDGIHSWTNWLKKYGVKGFFCETGWPNSAEGPRLYDGTTKSDIPQWRTLGNKIYSWFDASDVWVTYWTAAATQGDSIWKAYTPTDYSVSYAARVINKAYGQAAVIEAHRSTRAYKRGVNVNGGELMLGMNDFSNQNLGVYGQNYTYPNRASLAYLARRGHKVIRVPFRWERVQPTLTPGSTSGSLNSVEVDRLKKVVDNARAEGLGIILDPHNWAGYSFASGRKVLGSPGLPIAAFKDFWWRLSKQFKDRPGVAGYQLMNEPYGMPGGPSQWEKASQAAVNAIRSTGDKQRVMATGYFKSDRVPYSGIFGFVQHHPDPWIRDPLKKVLYTTHGYWGHYGYDWMYNESNAYWKNKGF